MEDLNRIIHILSGVNKEKRAQARVGVIITKRLKNTVRDCERINERILKINMSSFGRKLIILARLGI